MVRFKNRYLLCELKWEDEKYDPNIKNKDVYEAIKDSIGMNFGDFGIGLSVISLSIKYWNPVTNLFILRVSRECYRLVWAGLSLITHIRSRRVRPSVIYCAGTIRTCERKAALFIRNWLSKSKNPLERQLKELQAKSMMSELAVMIP
ncbi:unnamed protein product [Blepharisma stoltei]|uniref:Uncharacterized protein n=1 Tax=Blepharisma stoltei TaxID=1481888 RepID=A0AAU9IX07_9CILI|nr:unnamed protein product [Blepharisma stoltei]